MSIQHFRLGDILAAQRQGRSAAGSADGNSNGTCLANCFQLTEIVRAGAGLQPGDFADVLV